MYSNMSAINRKLSVQCFSISKQVLCGFQHQSPEFYPRTLSYGVVPLAQYKPDLAAAIATKKMNFEEIVTKIVDAGLINDEQPSVDVFDLDNFRGRVASLQAAFPEPYFNHAMAVKANSIRGIMKEAQRLGLGSECASMQEAKHSIALGMKYFRYLSFPTDTMYHILHPCMTYCIYTFFFL